MFRHQTTTKPPASGADLSRAMEAVPLHAPDIEAREDSRGRVHLRLRQPDPAGSRGLRARLAAFRPRPTLELDETGSRFWQLVNGRRTLADIASAIGGPDAPRRAVEESVLVFTRTLVARKLLLLAVHRPEPLTTKP